MPKVKLLRRKLGRNERTKKNDPKSPLRRVRYFRGDVLEVTDDELKRHPGWYEQMGGAKAEPAKGKAKT